MFVCMECGEIFNNTKQYVETHGLDSPPYESWYGCPYCGGSYAEAHKCAECDEWIVSEYIKTTSGHRICDGCYTKYDLGDED